MKECPPVIITTIGIAVPFGLICKLPRLGAPDREIRQIHEIVEKNLASTEAMHRKLRRACGAVNQIHQYPELVTKGPKNSAP